MHISRRVVIAKILITGATGFVGRHILEALDAINHPDLHIVAACQNKNKLPPSYQGEIRVGDLRDRDYLDRMLNGIDIVCHAAGWPSFTNQKEQSTKLYLEPTIDLINTALEWRIKRFVNLSSIAVASLNNRNNASTEGKPRRHAAMLNCMIAVENYLKAHASENFSVVNLRCGIYSGKSLTLGVMPALLSRLNSSWLAEVTGNYGYLPLVDGRDIGQAFARAALAPNLAFYESFNIVGPEVPTQKAVYDYLQTTFHSSRPLIKMPAPLFHLYSYLTGLFKFQRQAFITPALADFMTNPLIDNDKATKAIGYNPAVHWQASIQDDWQSLQSNPSAVLLTRPLKPSDIDN